METVPPPPPFDPSHDRDDRPAPARRRRWDDGAVVGGVARDVAARLGTDPLWVRLAFVVLTLFSGLGVVLYAGMWCVLRGLRRGGLATFWGLVGIAICLLGTVGLLGSGSTEYLGGPWSIVFALSGVAVALWVPRQATPTVSWQPPDAVARAGTDADTGTDGARTVVGGLVVPPPPNAAAGASPRRPVSWLGRWTLAVAVLVAVGGMVIDELNDGRLHPEQWLGAATIVCGVGIVLSAWRGFAMWLLVPAFAFATAGFVAGHAARVGLDELTLGSQQYTIWSDGTTDLPTWRSSSDVLGGEIDLWIDGALAEGRSTPNLRVAIGSIEIWSDSSVAVDVVGRVRSGTILDVRGHERDSDGEWHTYRLGPPGPADVVVRADVSVGDLRLHELTDLDMTRPRRIPVTPAGVPPVTAPASGAPVATAGGLDIGGGLTMTADGTVVFPNHSGDPHQQVWLSPDGSLGGPVGDPVGDNGVRTVYAGDGEYLVLPNQTIVTPHGLVVDVLAVRAGQAGQAGQAGEENSPEPETNPPAATSESVDDGAPSVTNLAATVATAPNGQD